MPQMLNSGRSVPRDLMIRYLRKRPLMRRSHLPNVRHHHRANLLSAAGEIAQKRSQFPSARKHQVRGSILSVDQSERTSPQL